MPTPSVQLGVKLNPDLYERLRAHARATESTLTAVVAAALEAHLPKKGSK